MKQPHNRPPVLSRACAVADDYIEAGSACSEFLTPEDASVTPPAGWGIWTVLAITGGIGFVCLLALHFCLRLADLVTKVPQ